VLGDRGRYNFCEQTYGEIICSDNADTASVETGVVIQITDFCTDGLYNNTEPDYTENHIWIKKSGVYKIDTVLCVHNNAAQSHILDVTIYLNNGTVELPAVHACHSLIGGQTTVYNMSLTGFAYLEAGETVELWATSNAVAARSITFENISLAIYKVA